MSYGRNFEFRVPPVHGQRSGRWVLSDTGLAADRLSVAIGAPVVIDTADGQVEDFTNAMSCKLALGAQAPVKGASGILVYEHAPAAFAGYDPFLTTYSDIDFAPVGKLVQVVSGLEIKVCFRNIAARTFLETRTYAAKKMVAGLGGATSSVAVGEFLTPGAGTDAAGYWGETSTAANGWLVVTAVDNDRAEVEARMLF